MVNTNALFFSLLYNEELLCVFRYKKKSAFRVGKKELLDTKKESRVFKVVVVVVVFFFRCVLGFVAHKVFSLSLSLSWETTTKKDSPSFCKGEQK